MQNGKFGGTKPKAYQSRRVTRFVNWVRGQQFMFRFFAHSPTSLLTATVAELLKIRVHAVHLRAIALPQQKYWRPEVNELNVFL